MIEVVNPVNMGVTIPTIVVNSFLSKPPKILSAIIETMITR
jgi:hypothetical protein